VKGRFRFALKDFMHINNRQKGFTLIEILIVVAIIAILASVVLVGLGPTQQAGRDARRLSDLRETQNALELYFNKCGYYPGLAEPGACGNYAAVASWNGTAPSLSTSLIGSTIGVNSIPNDPSSGHTYFYGATAGGASYVLAAVLENPGNSAFNGYTPPSNIPAMVGGNGIAFPGCYSSSTYCLTL
jgi:prepilin-type N-terminal cleavage/methylation domain-containing protein